MNLLETIRKAGVVGAGGAGFPTYKKLDAKADYFIVNAAECEPLIETDKFLIRAYADKLMKGIGLISDALGAKYRYIAIKHVYTKEIEVLKDAIKRNNVDVQLFFMNSFYPAGDEQLMVLDITGKTVPERGIPLALSAVVDNVSTVINVFEATEEKNVYEKYLSVVGEVKSPVMLKVPIGTSVTECINAAEPLLDHYVVMMGGPMMGKVYTDQKDIAALSVTKTDNNILVLPPTNILAKRAELSLAQLKNQTKSACIQCRFCTQMCPRYLSGHNMTPHKVMRNLYLESELTDNTAYAEAFGSATNCSECGICELYACPMQLSPRKVNAYIKQQLRTRGIDVAKTPNPVARGDYLFTRVPTGRLVARLGLSKYYHLPLAPLIELTPKRIAIPLRQHIGVPALPCVKQGDFVRKGDRIASVPNDKLGADVHAGIDGVVTEITGNTIVVERS